MAVLQHMYKKDWLFLCFTTGCFFVMAILCYVTFNEILKQDIYATTGVHYITCDSGKCYYVKAKVAKDNSTIQASGTPTTFPVNGVNFSGGSESDRCSTVEVNDTTQASTQEEEPTPAFGYPVNLLPDGVVSFSVSCGCGRCSTVQVNDTTQPITQEKEPTPAFRYPINLLPGETAQFVVTCDHGPCSTKEIKNGEQKPSRINRRSVPATNDASNPKYGAVIFKLVCETGGCIISLINDNEKLIFENEEPVFDPIQNSTLG